jgi:hypothetical protein
MFSYDDISQIFLEMRLDLFYDGRLNADTPTGDNILKEGFRERTFSTPTSLSCSLQ